MLDLVCTHLHLISKHAGVNLMHVQNLSVVFGPTLIKSHLASENVLIAVKEMQHQIKAVESLIEYCEFIFNPEIVLKSMDTVYDAKLDAKRLSDSQISSFKSVGGMKGARSRSFHESSRVVVSKDDIALIKKSRRKGVVVGSLDPSSETVNYILG